MHGPLRDVLLCHCEECRRWGGYSSLFWQQQEDERIHIAAGTLDRPTGLRIAGHWYPHQAGDYDELPDNGLPDASVTHIRWS